MKDKNGAELIGVVANRGLSRAEDNPQKILTPWGTGFVWVADTNQAEIHLDGGGVLYADNPIYLEVIE